MQKSLRRFHETRKLEGDYLEKLFGNTTIIHRFAKFYEKFQDEFELISAIKLNEFVSDPKNEFNSRDIDFYKLGQAELPKIFIECYEWVKIKHPDTVFKNIRPEKGNTGRRFAINC